MNAKIKKVLLIFFPYLLLLISCFCLSVYAADYKPQNLFSKDCLKENKEFVVKHVFDGDTILLNNNQKIRLLGIDTFELEQNQYGKIAKDFLIKLVLNKKICVETDVQEKDIYGRTLGYVFFKNVIARRSLAMTSQEGLFINEELLKNGLAILYDFPPNIKYLLRLKKAQIYARQNMLGIWEKQSYILETPAQWRHGHPFKKH